jgi:hypothetical protein
MARRALLDKVKGNLMEDKKDLNRWKQGRVEEHENQRVHSIKDHLVRHGEESTTHATFEWHPMHLST